MFSILEVQTSCKITKSDILSMYCISSVFENYLSSSEKFSSSVGKFALKNRALDAAQCGQIFFKFAFKSSSKLFSEKLMHSFMLN